MRRFHILPILLMLCLMLCAVHSSAQAPAPQQVKPYVIEYYYKVKWGHQEEFLRLFRKNHWPVLKKGIEIGRLLRVEAVTPRYHMPESARWDYRVTITFKDAATATQEVDPAPLIAQLYPDKAKFEQEEQRRFEILEAHWDLPVGPVDLDKAQP